MSTYADYPIGCVVLAAGESRRFGADKRSATLDGVPLLERALCAVPKEKLDAVCVVTRGAEAMARAARRGFGCVLNDKPELGLSRSVRLGTEALRARCRAILYLVADQPLLRKESVGALLDFARVYPDRIVAAAHDGKRGNPCLFPEAFFPELCALSGDAGGGAVIRAHPAELLLFELDARELLDVDTPRELQNINVLI